MRQVDWVLFEKERNRKQKEKSKEEVEMNNVLYFLFRYE